jgi:mRNA interferase RelE/StbE
MWNRDVREHIQRRRLNVPWAYEFDAAALKALLKLSAPVQQEIVRYLKERVTAGDPTRFGKPLFGPLKGRWRVGDYQILGKVFRERLFVLVVDVGHHSSIYD